MIDDYTRLLEATAELEDKEASDAAITKLIMHLKSAGRMKMLPAIARELRKVAARRHALRPYVEVAHEKEAAAALRAAAQMGIIARHAHVNHSLIHGWRARSKGKLIDHSAKRALLHIYQKVTV
ncbi:MAG: F0F1 ATP synthase subunit delta [Candidatus Pacebacteria bacterium]|nr:F0F1 ATP synthase subunit delta [Candidatus Paceibacterota bacterium]